MIQTSDTLRRIDSDAQPAEARSLADSTFAKPADRPFQAILMGAMQSCEGIVKLGPSLHSA